MSNNLEILARGRKELRAHRGGKRLTQRQAIYAKCYDCMGYYADGKEDCKMPHCPLYPLMPYRASVRAQKTEGAILA